MAKQRQRLVEAVQQDGLRRRFLHQHSLWQRVPLGAYGA